MQITTESYGHSVVLNMKGEFTDDSLQAFKQAVDRELNGNDVAELVLNLEMVPFVDSAALEYLLDLRDRLAGGGAHLRLAKPDENVRNILRITRLDGAMEVIASVHETIRPVQA